MFGESLKRDYNLYNIHFIPQSNKKIVCLKSPKKRKLLCFKFMISLAIYLEHN